MSINKTYAVFGLGRYGMAVAKELIANGADVLAVDSDEDIINNAIAEIPLCKCADVTDEEVLKQLGISNIDVVIIAMATNLEASVMAVTLCKDAGVKTVIAKCGSEMHQRILSRVGADKVLLPEYESGIRLAKNLISSGFVDMVELSDDFSIVELDVKPQWEGKTLLELNLRRKYSINVIGIRKNDKITIEIDPELQLDDSMKLIVVANNAKLSKIK
ncbi:MAG: TrkA family potassium uptake protein [Ruminococcaceae bacterium]|nr:TrkA family potassium uptake protein [Oscillospiraceae bacterium]